MFDLVEAKQDADGFWTGWMPEGLTDTQYHNDFKMVHPTFSVSRAKYMVSDEKTPFHLRAGLDGIRAAPTADMEEGTIRHAILTGREDQELVILDNVRKKDGDLATSFQAAEAKAIKASALRAGKIALFRSQYEFHKARAESLRAWLLTEYGIDPATCLMERALYWVDRAKDGTKVQCKMKLDMAERDPFWTVVDLKNPASGSLVTFQKAMVRLGYDLQMYAYPRAIQMVQGLDYRPDFKVINWERSAAAPASMITSSDNVLFGGGVKWHVALNRFVRCLASNSWPAFHPSGAFVEVDYRPWDWKEIERLQRELDL